MGLVHRVPDRVRRRRWVDRNSHRAGTDVTGAAARDAGGHRGQRYAPGPARCRGAMNRFPALVLVALVASCGRPADPTPAGGGKTELTAAFDALYGTNCAGCHGVAGRNGAALSLNDSVYRAIVDPAAARRAIAAGVPGTLMPAFARAAGGTLADSEIDVLVEGIRSRWGRPSASELPGAPSYADRAGDSGAGAGAYAT